MVSNDVVPDLWAGKHDTEICLAMIVKNESCIIERCMDAVRKVVTNANLTICICDTGSEDDTVTIIDNWCTKNGLLNRSGSFPWPGKFNVARNNLLEIAVNSILLDHNRQTHSYLLLLDADMILEGTLDGTTLLNDYQLLQQSLGGLLYPNNRILRVKAGLKSYDDFGWRYKYSTHEALSNDSPDVKLSTIDKEVAWINDVGDGGSKSDKYTRDHKLLLADVIEDPTLTRERFYLARTCFDMAKGKGLSVHDIIGRLSESAHHHMIRITLGGYDEERWYSMMEHARCYIEISRRATLQSLRDHYFNIGKVGLLAAHKYSKERGKERLEPLYYLAAAYREFRQYAQAWIILKIGSTIALPPPGSLFVSVAMYSYMILFEMSIVGYYIKNKRAEGKAASDELLKRIAEQESGDREVTFNITTSIINSVRYNAKFYELPSAARPEVEEPSNSTGPGYSVPPQTKE